MNLNPDIITQTLRSYKIHLYTQNQYIMKQIVGLQFKMTKILQ